ncbi:hypothetical protein J4E96_09920 [Pengzhenrongella sicca]|uniref:Uncharacterized protein n=2 Tax=Pengzhenrongella sicca TaxID=2819238 RepID=A0A8A4ZHD5_9MICO|nr:hypothetical protein J4E96_09920 [Pengzhenrongella sicca]
MDDDAGDLVVARSFVVRAMLERPDVAPARWHGFITDAETGERHAWRRVADIARSVEATLAAAAAGPRRGSPGGLRIRGAAMAGPALTDVVTDMLTVLGLRLPAAAPALPDPNVTLERVQEKLVGLGNHRGDEPTGTLGTRTLRGGRLDARVRFQLWAASAPDVDAAMQLLHTTLLDDGADLRQEGFLRFAAAGTTLAEHVPTVGAGAWRKASSFDLLYEYQFVDADDAASLIARLEVTTDPEVVAGPGRERGSIVDELARWDDEGAPDLVVRGPAGVARVSALTFVPGPALGGTVTFARSSGTGAPAAHLPDLDAFWLATAGARPAQPDADVTLTPALAFAALGPPAPGLELGDWDADATPDAYTAFDRRLDDALVLPTAADRFTLTYTPPGGGAGLDQTAVVYLRVNPP